MSDVTRLIDAASDGDGHAAAELLVVVYDELRKLAAARLSQESPDQTLQPTGLVHEAYLRLIGGRQEEAWHTRGHFFAAAAEAMRRILVENARRKRSQRQGGGRARLQLTDDGIGSPADAADADRVLTVHEALDALDAESPRMAQLVKLRFFAGMTLEEAAAVLRVAVPTAKRDWAAARVWLYRWLQAAE